MKRNTIALLAVIGAALVSTVSAASAQTRHYNNAAEYGYDSSVSSDNNNAAPYSQRERDQINAD